MLACDSSLGCKAKAFKLLLTSSAGGAAAPADEPVKIGS